MKMRMRRPVLVMSALVACALASAGTTSAANTGFVLGPTCTGGVIQPGFYVSMRITGFCSLPDSGTVFVEGPLSIAPKAGLNGITDATLYVGLGISVGRSGVLGL